jgi:hypothetical protein
LKRVALLLALSACSHHAAPQGRSDLSAGNGGNSDGDTFDPDGGSGQDTSFGTIGHGGGAIAQAPCENVQNPTAANPIDLPWPAASNIGPNGAENGSLHFHWQGSHNVLQIATWPDVFTPTVITTNSHWANQLYSGAKATNGTFDWNFGAFPCGYRPGIYFFVDEGQDGIVSTEITVPQGGSHYDPQSCSALSSPNVYGGRYSAYASRPNCKIYEVNNFQTDAHFDWVNPAFAVNQGDLVLFRWTGNHNVVQVHDATKDALVAGGITSGAKTNCVGGPNYSCVNGAPTLGEYLIDTITHMPGEIHISDECATTCTGHSTGMNMEFLIHAAKPVAYGSCCGLHDGKTHKTSCRLIDNFNSGDGAQFDYQTGVGAQDVVRFRWAGSLRIYQSVPNANGSPSNTVLSGGVAMPSALECVPGPNFTCLNGTTATAQFLFDIADAIAANHYQEAYGVKNWTFHATGENTDGYTSADTNAIIYTDNSVTYAPNAPDCP